MINRRDNGFTIIELMLVLAISGSLLAVILVGSSTAINQQRYRDSVNSLKSFIQNQYDKVSNTDNDRSGSEGCTAMATVTTSPTQAEPRGTSECVILGRLVTIAANGTDLSAVDVLGYRAATVVIPPATPDIAELKTYKLGASTTSVDTDTVAWSAKVVQPHTTNPQSLSMLIVRSPQSGSIMTFTVAGTVPGGGPLAIVNASGSNTTARDLCVSPSSFSSGLRMEVRIAAGASGQGDIQVPLESDSVCN